jgi:uncharacterized RDD family membrane protein YckC
MTNEKYSINTPENVNLNLELAGLGNRILACAVDFLIAIVLNLSILTGILLLWLALRFMPLSTSAMGICSTVLIMTAVTCTFAVIALYSMLFEGIWQGQTPGKKLAGIRVIENNGQPVNWSSVVVRNLTRIVDQGILFIGLLSMFLDKNERRLGDFAAGTLVIREYKPKAIYQTILTATENANQNLDVGRITPSEYNLLTTYLKRRTEITEDRELLAKKLEEYCQDKVGTKETFQSAEGFLESVYNSYQSRAT